jgi:hypothetical protein
MNGRRYGTRWFPDGRDFVAGYVAASIEHDVRSRAAEAHAPKRRRARSRRGPMKPALLAPKPAREAAQRDATDAAAAFLSRHIAGDFARVLGAVPNPDPLEKNHV